MLRIVLSVILDPYKPFSSSIDKQKIQETLLLISIKTLPKADKWEIITAGREFEKLYSDLRMSVSLEQQISIFFVRSWLIKRGFAAEDLQLFEDLSRGFYDFNSTFLKISNETRSTSELQVI